MLPSWRPSYITLWVKSMSLLWPAEHVRGDGCPPLQSLGDPRPQPVVPPVMFRRSFVLLPHQMHVPPSACTLSRRSPQAPQPSFSPAPTLRPGPPLSIAARVYVTLGTVTGVLVYWSATSYLCSLSLSLEFKFLGAEFAYFSKNPYIITCTVTRTW